MVPTPSRQGSSAQGLYTGHGSHVGVVGDGPVVGGGGALVGGGGGPVVVGGGGGGKVLVAVVADRLVVVCGGSGQSTVSWQFGRADALS